MRTQYLMLAFMLFTVIARGQTATNANVKGHWQMEVVSSAGNGSPVFELEHTSETAVTGSYKGRLGSAPVKGTVKGNTIHLEFTINGTVIEYDGTVDGDTAKGKVKFGSMAEGTFSGKRTK